jgi:hypothetical protein
VYCYIANPLSVSVGAGVFDLYDWDDASERTLHVLPGTAEAYYYYYYYEWYWYFEQVIEDLIPEPQPGDVNGDREVNIADVNAAIDIILNGSENPSGDVNGDGEINIADINAVIDIILNGTQN